MKTWIFETSSESALLALYDGESPLIELLLPGGDLSKTLAAHAEKIISQIPPPYSRIVLGAGPGSYTGIRVGASLAQALAFGWKIPLYTASSLAAFTAPGPHAVAIDARMGGVYLQLPGQPPQKLPLDQAAPLLTPFPQILTPHPDKLRARLPHLTFTLASPQALPLLRAATPAPLASLNLLYL